MWHKMNGVSSRRSLGKTPRKDVPTHAVTEVPKRARMAAIIVSVAATWLILSSVRLLFDPGLEILPHDSDFFEFLYSETRQPVRDEKLGTSVSWSLSKGERFQSRVVGVFLLYKALHEFIVTFGGSDPRTFKLLSLLNVMLVWASATAVPMLPVSTNSGFVLQCLSALEAPALWVLSGTNGVYEPDDDDHDD